MRERPERSSQCGNGQRPLLPVRRSQTYLFLDGFILDRRRRRSRRPEWRGGRRRGRSLRITNRISITS